MPPGSLGHEAWGTIEAVGDGVHSRLTGEHVATLSTQAYAECVNCPVEDTAVLPEPLTHDAFPGEPLACTMNIIDRSDIRPGQHVAVIGIGFLGALLTRMAATAGAHVIAIARRDSSLDVARRQGAEAAIRWDHRATVVDEVRRLTGAAGCQRVIEAVGKQEAVDLAGELVAERGRLVVAGYHQDGLRQVNMQSWNWRGIDVINAHERDPDRYRSGLQRAIRAVAAGLLDPLALCTHRFPLGQLGAALEMARERPDGFIKALVLM
jgi:threonine dehydrogenase-like Zn-dependent dehydrogenase